MTTDDKIDLIITRLTEKAKKFYWCRTTEGDYSIVVSDKTGYRFIVSRDTTIRVLSAFGEHIIPPEDLNTPRTQPLRTKLASTVAQLYSDRSELLQDLLDQLKEL